MSRLLLRCGCEVPFEDGKAPRCPTHGAQSVARVLGMRKPTFRGHATGPHVTQVDLEPFTGQLVGSPEKES